MRAHIGAIFPIMHIIAGSQALASVMIVSPPKTPNDRFYPGGNSLSAIA